MVDVGLKAVNAASIIIKEYFRKDRDSYKDKDAKSAIVTAADIEAESVMRSIILEYYPDHSIQGEELDLKLGSSEYTWILDPIDGTSNFVMGKPIFGTLLALYKNKQPLFGIIHQPILNETFLGVIGENALFNNKILKTANTNSVKAAFLATNPIYMFESKYEKSVLWDLQNVVRAVEFGGDCYNYAMLALGHIDIVLTSGDDLHDFAAIIPIVKSSGGIITDWTGNELSIYSSGHILATCNSNLHETVLNRLKNLN